MNKTTAIILSTILISACSQSPENNLSSPTTQQLSGAWGDNSGTGNIRFYHDETVKLEFPRHNPPIKLISQYQDLKKDTIGIALGGFWSSPILINTSRLTDNIITVTFPEGEPFHLRKTTK